MADETRILGSFLGLDLSSVNEVSALVDSSRYVLTAAYITNVIVGAADAGIHAEVWTGPGGTGTKLIAIGNIPPNPSPPSLDDIRALALLVTPSAAFGRVLAAGTLYWRTTVPKGAGLTGDVHFVGFDIP